MPEEISQYQIEIFGNYKPEELRQKGYEPIGMPALLREHPRRVKSEQLRNAVEKTNGKIDYDAIVFYWKMDANANDAPTEKEYTQIIGDLGGTHALIVWALRKIH